MTSCVRGYHVYGESWVAVLGEELHCEREVGNIMDWYAVRVKKLGTSETVGYLPRKISRRCSMFLQSGGDIIATVTGSRRYSSDLVQGGIKIPCILTFRGSRKEIMKLKKLKELKKRLQQLLSSNSLISR